MRIWSAFYWPFVCQGLDRYFKQERMHCVTLNREGERQKSLKSTIRFEQQDFPKNLEHSLFPKDPPVFTTSFLKIRPFLTLFREQNAGVKNPHNLNE